MSVIGAFVLVCQSVVAYSKIGCCNAIFGSKISFVVVHCSNVYAILKSRSFDISHQSAYWEREVFRFGLFAA